MVLVRRTAAHFDSAEDVERGHAELVQVLDGLPREQLALLVDLRQAPARNDPEFERLMQAYRPRIFARFARRAVLVKTAVGRLHVQRHARSDGHSDLGVFTDEQAALDYATRGK